MIYKKIPLDFLDIFKFTNNLKGKLYEIKCNCINIYIKKDIFDTSLQAKYVKISIYDNFLYNLNLFQIYFIICNYVYMDIQLFLNQVFEKLKAQCVLTCQTDNIFWLVQEKAVNFKPKSLDFNQNEQGLSVFATN